MRQRNSKEINMSLSIVKHQAMKAYWRVKIQLHVFISALRYNLNLSLSLIKHHAINIHGE
jgi:hypothetical protein